MSDQCPFCGSDETEPRSDHATMKHYIWCRACEARGPAQNTALAAGRLWVQRCEVETANSDQRR